MPVERSAGAVIFRKTKKGIDFLLIQHPDLEDKKKGIKKPGHWDFPKGHIEKGEKTEDTAKREVEEETGLRRIEIIPDFKETMRYFVKIGEEKRLKFVAFFLAETKEKKVTISWEHQDFAWLSYKEAYERVTFRNAKELLKKSNDFIHRKSI